ncbi:MAG: sulfate adenylyltransferase subunit CysN [Rhodospirillales bacterium]
MIPADAADAEKDLLRFILCGGVDDGKSTLIGRLLHDSQQVPEDHLVRAAEDSKTHGTQGGALDLALLTDGLQAEREQGITIDVAYRCFSTPKRAFIAADAPGHEQYTRNMATGASTADAAVILADVRQGVLTQTKRHSYIVSLLGVENVILAVNKMDLADYDEAAFNAVADHFRAFAQAAGLKNVTCIPVSALAGDMVFERGAAMPWHKGPTLTEALEAAPLRSVRADAPFRMPVQLVSRPNPDFRGFAGTVAGGTVRPGDKVKVCPAGTETAVERIVTADGDLPAAEAGQAVTLTFTDHVDVSRGDVIAAASAPPEATDHVQAHLIWMSETPLLPERQYIIKTGAAETTGRVTDLKYAVNVNTLEHTAAKTLELNAVAVCNVALDRPVAFDSYQQNRATGAFILIDRQTNATLAAGMVDFGLRRAANVHWHELKISKALRAEQKKQKPCVLWFTGLSGSGKSTVADALEQKLAAMGRHTYLLDGDNVRHGLNRDLGFTDADRVENIRRTAETAKLFTDAGLIVLVSFISPFRSERETARALMDDGEFVEVFVDTPLNVCEARDPKGLYKKARAGEIKNFTGLDSAYEPPEAPEIMLDTQAHAPGELAGQIIAWLEQHGRLG